jgi:tRNA modification GTPase
MYDDTIAAIATPVGDGGIGIIRISGDQSPEIACRLFRRGKSFKPTDVRALRSHHLHYGHIVDPSTDRAIDEVLLVRMAAPHSYTREEVIEISCHGGPAPLREILRLILSAGARQAEPGEFTLRAFLNGRIDLSQAEAVMAVVSARTSESLHLAVEELRGRLSSRLGPARDALIEALAFLDAAADFPEDEIPPLDLTTTLASARTALEQVVSASRIGMLYREGIQIAIVGRPNVGKSSLLNTLLKTERAIVTDIAGTTRDIITETVNVRGIPAMLVDTAGIAETADIIERIGIDRSRQAVDTAGMILFVLDGSQPTAADDLHVANLLAPVARDDAGRIIIVCNKRDLPEVHTHGEILERLPESPVVKISTITHAGIDHLEEVLYECLVARAGEAAEPAMVTMRQQEALRRALGSTEAASRALDDAVPLDLVAVDVREALDAIGEVTGERVSESVLNEIFSRFCIGK